MSFASRTALKAGDPVAIAVELCVRSMQAEGYGEFLTRPERDQLVLNFGGVEARGETYDVALLRLSVALLDHAHFFQPFFTHLRTSTTTSSLAHLQGK